MKWMVASVLLGTGNVVLIMLFAASKLGPTPLFLPLILGAISSCCIVVSTFLTISARKRKDSHIAIPVFTIVIWSGLAVFNLLAFQSVLYVS